MSPRSDNPKQPATSSRSQGRFVRVGRVYLLWGRGTDRFKIGYTARGVRERALEIDGMSAVPVLVQGSISGTPAEEKRLHRYFRKFHCHGDWFRFDEPAAWEALRIFGCL